MIYNKKQASLKILRCYYFPRLISQLQDKKDKMAFSIKKFCIMHLVLGAQLL